MTNDIPTVYVRGEIRLGQLLKLTGLVENGGEARAAIQGGYVSVDGTVETRRGKRLANGQVVSLDFGDHVESVRVESQDESFTP
ncbi:MAG: RNA-binding S4 domain-containing protein [Actinomycetaceae bacterium]|nr:RNA-binding S4 domain-containing protein [Actinomycetaceae bacterium]